MYGSVRAASEPVHEVVRRPRSRELQLALPHHGAGGLELVLVPFNAFAIDQVRDIEEHFSALCHSAADFFV
jgi:hypothetical protein